MVNAMTVYAINLQNSCLKEFFHMEKGIINIKQCALIISLRCNLRCKLCLVYSPYYKNPQDFPLKEVIKSIDTFFSLVDTCGTLNIQGGEPLLHKDLPAIINRTVAYKKQIGKILLTTNGTILPSTSLIQSLKQNRDYVQINISDYGPNLSKKVTELIEMLKKAEITYRVISYHGDDVHFGGWLDFTDHTYKHHTEEELIRNAEACGYRNGGNLAIRLGELYFCTRVARRIELGIIEKNELSYIDMYSTKSFEEKRKNIRNILEAQYTPACAYCVGKRSHAKHYPAAVQLTKEDLIKGVEKI